MNYIEKLQEMASYCAHRQTEGLPLIDVEKFANSDPRLKQVIDDAYQAHWKLREEFENVMRLDENEQIKKIQESYVNFYPRDTVNPYIGLAAVGPWLITTCGAVLYDAGGYGMMGFGHGPQAIMKAMSQNHCMANVMTPNFLQIRFIKALNREIGHRRSHGHTPVYGRFLCLNSGSESITLAARISDLNARKLTDPGGRHAGKKVWFLAQKGAFHGRTERPAQVSDSSLKKYQESLASFRDLRNLLVVDPNNTKQLTSVFSRAKDENIFIEAMFLEPVMGEGDPGKAVTPEFYQKARELTAENGTLLIVDSIQAGLRTQGCLSIVDYPGFETLPPPDIEAFSKALNGGQYPLSVLGMLSHVAQMYETGVYGNTMTTNPRALAVGCAVLESVTDDLRTNIRTRGKEFVDKLTKLQREYGHVIEKVQGTGLLFSVAFNKDKLTVVGNDGIETYLRRHGIGVIHGGTNSLRYTPHFAVTGEEVDLVVGALRNALQTLAPL